MADPGSLITQDYQIELWKDTNNALLIGAGTDYHMLEVKGLSKVSVVSSDFDRQAGHGSYVVLPERMPGRQIDILLAVKGPSMASLVSKLDTLMKYLNPVSTATICTLRWPGRSVLRAKVFPRVAEWEDSATEVQGGTKLIVCEFFVPDPIFYSNTVSSTDLVINSPDLSIIGSITNDGNISTYPTFSIVGPATNIILTNTTNGNKQIKVNYILGAGDTLVIDGTARTAHLNGVRRTDLIKTDTQWWDILPGANSITYSRSNTNGTTTATITHRSGWSGI